MISSRRHPLVQQLRATRDGKDKKLIFVEGPKLVEEALQSSVTAKLAVCTKVFSEGPHRSVLGLLKSRKVEPILFSPDVFEFISDLENSPGIVVLMERPGQPSEKKFAPGSLSLILEGLQNPNNLGAILRVAEASGVDAVWLTEKSVDPFNPKVLRGSSGSAFRVPVVSGLTAADVQERLREDRVSVVCASPRQQRSYTEHDWRGSKALVLGHESRGVSSLWDSADKVTIPMGGKIESLNVAAAAAVLLFEAKRQREAKK